MKTKAAILYKIGHPLEIEEVDVPILQTGQVLVKVLVSRICGSQLGEIDGIKGKDKWLPHMLGHEGCGIVLEIGPGVNTLKVNDKVVMHWRPGSGIQSVNPIYYQGNKTINAGSITTFNNYAVVSENRLTSIPKKTNNELGALLADTITTGYGIVNNAAKVTIGQSVVVIGAGGIGLGVIHGCSIAGANPIIAVDLYEKKLKFAKKHGATHIINSRKKNVQESVLKILGDKPDCIIDGTGNPKVIESAYQLIKNNGTLVLFGVMNNKKCLKINTLPLHLGKKLIGTEGGESKPNFDIPKYLKFFSDKNFDPSCFVSHRFELDNINNGIKKMREGQVIHAMINF